MENNSSLHDYKQKYPFLDIVYIMDGDEKVHYIAKQDVPRNTKITDTRYWQPIDLSSTSSEVDDIFNNIIDVTDVQRNKALANISNQKPTNNGKLGYKVLDPTKTFIEQVTEANTIYEIRDVFDLGGTEQNPVRVTIPIGCTLEFNGGTIKNCTLIGSDTTIKGNAQFYNITGGGYFKTRIISVQWFGAKGDGITDDTAAIKSALQFVINISYNGYHNNVTNYNHILNSLYFPTGRYAISESNVFCQYSTTTPKFYLDVIGDGEVKSVLYLKTNSENTLWFYNTEGSGNYNKSGHFYFRNLQFTTDNRNYGNGFLQYSTGQEKQLRFENCSISLGTFIKNTGTGNADLTIVDKCRITCNECIILANPQSVTNRFINCNIYSTSNTVERRGGGTAAFAMCEIEVFFNESQYQTILSEISELEQSKDGKTDEDIAIIESQIAEIKYNAGLSYNGYNTNRKNIIFDEGANVETSVIDFSSCRFELHGIVGLYHANQLSNYGNAIFNSCTFGYYSNFSDFISTVFNKNIALINCQLYSSFSIKFLGNDSVITSSFIRLLNCSLKEQPTISGKGGYCLIDNCKSTFDGILSDRNNLDMQYYASNHNTSLKCFNVAFSYVDMKLIKSGNKSNATIRLGNNQKAIGYIFIAKYDSGAGMPNDPQTFTLEGSVDNSSFENISTINAGPAKNINVIEKGAIQKDGYKYFKLTRSAQYSGAKPGCDITCIIQYI